jgi:5'-deoxynucleotidase YfbR-like HD superfamily hydrolase
MKNLGNLFKLAELTRAQVQQGYLLSGVQRERISNLAEHHYLVTFIGWQLAVNLKEAGVDIDVQKVMEFCMIHDLGELMGGDISAWYAGMNPKARRFAKSFEAENQKYLAKFFGNDAKRFKKMSKEILDAKTDEALIAKVADYMESMNFMVYHGYFSEARRKFTNDKVSGYIRKIKNKATKKLLTEFLATWIKDVDKNDYIKILNDK